MSTFHGTSHIDSISVVFEKDVNFATARYNDIVTVLQTMQATLGSLKQCRRISITVPMLHLQMPFATSDPFDNIINVDDLALFAFGGGVEELTITTKEPQTTWPNTYGAQFICWAIMYGRNTIKTLKLNKCGLDKTAIDLLCSYFLYRNSCLHTMSLVGNESLQLAEMDQLLKTVKELNIVRHVTVDERFMMKWAAFNTSTKKNDWENIIICEDLDEVMTEFGNLIKSILVYPTPADLLVPGDNIAKVTLPSVEIYFPYWTYHSQRLHLETELAFLIRDPSDPKKYIKTSTVKIGATYKTPAEIAVIRNDVKQGFLYNDALSLRPKKITMAIDEKPNTSDFNSIKKTKDAMTIIMNVMINFCNDNAIEFL
jgi:hypothetical protein